MTSKLQEPCGSGVGKATDQQPFSGPLESASLRAGPFSGPNCASCPASLAPGEGHLACFRCLGAEHAAVALVTPASCAACCVLLSRQRFFSTSLDLSEAIDIYKAGVPEVDDDDHIEVDGVASLDDVFADSVSGFSHSRASTATIVPR